MTNSVINLDDENTYSNGETNTKIWRSKYENNRRWSQS